MLARTRACNVNELRGDVLTALVICQNGKLHDRVIAGRPERKQECTKVTGGRASKKRADWIRICAFCDVHTLSDGSYVSCTRLHFSDVSLGCCSSSCASSQSL